MAESFPVQFGDYRLLNKLAQGGMAEIFLAQDPKGEICAIKRILPHLAHEESFIRMFIDEARIVSHLDHPNIAGVYDQGKVDGYYFIAMEFVQGHSLLAVSERAKQVKMPLPRGLLAYVVAELLAGLGCAHSARDGKGRHLGIVHRDVTPQNVLISYTGEVKLVDFGVAKARARLTQTEAGFTKGKLSYMSPEQARGEELDGRSDLFSVGIILHEITTNGRLFNKEGPGGILGAIVNDPIPKPSMKVKGFPKELESVVMMALAKEVDTRYQSAEEMRDALMRYARKERPQPGQRRLKELVYDLFGPPDSQKDIDRAQASSVRTPEHVKAHREVSEASMPVQRAASRQRSSQRPKEDETRMMPFEMAAQAPPSKVARNLEITSDGTPIVQLPIPGEDRDIPVPQVKEPGRVRAARFLTALVDDLAISWRTKKKRWIRTLALVGLVLFVGVGLLTGLFGKISDGVGNLAKSAKEFREQEGLTERPEVDAGFLPTKLRLVSEPPGARITINDLGMGEVTPHTIEDLPSGLKLKVELALPGYRPYTEELVLRDNQGLVEYTMTLEKRSGGLKITSEPPGARVYVDSKRTEHKTPASLGDLPAEAPINVRVAKKGFVGDSKVVTVADGAIQKVHFDLELDESKVPGGTISIESSPSGCSVFVAGKFVGTSPVNGVSARPGSHAVRVACDHYGEQTRSVMVWSGQSTPVSFSLQPTAFGYLTIRPVPAQGSVVRINGQRVPTPVEFRKVVPGRHVVTVQNRRLRQERRLEVDVGPDARITRRVNLLQ